MDTEIFEFSALADCRPSHDGRRMAFSIQFRNREALQISCRLQEIPTIIAFLAKAAIAIRRSDANSDTEANSLSAGLSLIADSITASGAGFATDRHGEPSLVIHLAPGLNLAFAIPRTKLGEVAANLSRTAQTLSADPKARQ